MKADKLPAETPQQIGDNNKRGTRFLNTCFAAWNALSGAGIIALPFMLSKSGWMGLPLLFTLASITCYTAILLQRCMESNTNIKTYPDIGFFAFGWKGRAIVSTFMFLELYLISVGFLVLVGDNLHKLFPDVGFRIGQIDLGGKCVFTILGCLVILPSMWVTDSRKITLVYAFGILSSVIIIGCLVWVGTGHGVGFHAKGKLFDLGGVPMALSLIMFCYGAHPVYPILYSSMQEKNHFTKVLFISFGISTVSYMSAAALGYAMFGHDARPQITLNLPTHETSTRIAVCTTLVSPVAKYVLIITPVAEAIEKNLLSYYYHIKLIRILLRTSILISTLFVALLFPYLDSLMELIGSVLNVAVSIVFPCLCYLKISKKGGCEVGVIVVIVVLGLVVAVLGTYSAIKQILRRLDISI